MASSFEKLLVWVRRGELSLTFVLGLARGGTTAIERHLFQSLNYDAQVNEPSLLGPPPEGDEFESRVRVDLDARADAREEATFAVVLAAVQRLVEREHDRDLRSLPLRVIVKEVTNKAMPRTMPRWIELASFILVVVRNPLLQLESRLKSIVDRVSSGALRSFGVHDDVPVAEASLRGEALLLGDCGEATWGEAWAEMRRKRNFARLGPGLARLASLHPFCAWPECQRMVWEHCSVSGDDKSWPLGLPMHRLGDELPRELCDAFLEWRLGWTPLRAQLDSLLSLPRSRLQIIDFSCFQHSPGTFVAAVAEALAPHWGAYHFDEAPKAGKVGLELEASSSFAVCAATERWESGAWDAWYGVPCFGRAAASRVVDPVSKGPIEVDALPGALLASEVELGQSSLLHDAYDLYLELLSDHRTLAPPLDAHTPYLGLDPLHDLLWCSLRGRPLDELNAVVARHMRSSAADAVECSASPAALWRSRLQRRRCRAELATSLGSKHCEPAAGGVCESLDRWADCCDAAYVVLAWCAVLVVQLVSLGIASCFAAFNALALGATADGAQEAYADKGDGNDDRTSLLTIVVLAYNEEASIGTALTTVSKHLSAHSPSAPPLMTPMTTSLPTTASALALPRIEVIVVDGGCTDGTLDVVRRVAASSDFTNIKLRVTSAVGGRGAALSVGIAAADPAASMFLLLHADTVLPPNYDRLVSEALSSPGSAMCFFRFCANRTQLKTRPPRRGVLGAAARRVLRCNAAEPVGLGLMELGVRLRSEYLGAPYGDQGLALTRRALVGAGGVPPLPLFEDYELVRQIQRRKVGRILALDSPALTSPRRYEALGVSRACFINQLCVLAYASGVSPNTLFQWYYAFSGGEKKGN